MLEDGQSSRDFWSARTRLRILCPPDSGAVAIRPTVAGGRGHRGTGRPPDSPPRTGRRARCSPAFTGAMFVLAVAADMARTTWPSGWRSSPSASGRQGHEQPRKDYEHRSAPAPREERSTPIASLLFSFVWLEPDRAGRHLDARAGNLALLRRDRDQPAHARRQHRSPAPSPGPSTPTGPGTSLAEVDDCVTADAQGALEALERFDEA